MKRLTLTLFSAALLMIACNNKKEDTSNTDKDSSGSKVSSTSTMEPMDSATMMKNWQEAMTPGKEHEMLAKCIGTWNAEVTMWMAPGEAPQTSNGTVTTEMVMGGRYQISHHKSTMMGMPFEGMSVTGYDNSKKVFVNNWMDNMGTGFLTTEGSWDDATKSITMKGKMMDPGMRKEIDVKEVLTFTDDNNQLFQMFVPGPDGKEFKTMEAKYSRKK